MLSDILKMTVSENEIAITKAHICYVLVCNVRELLKSKKVSGVLINQAEFINEEVEIGLNADLLVVNGKHGITQFFPHDMQRCIIKDLNKKRDFDLDYRKHLVYDYSKEHYSLVIPYEVTEKTLAKAKEIVRRHSTGKNNKPTGIVLDFKVIVVKGDSNYQYDL